MSECDEFTEANTITYPGKTGRWCRECRRLRTAARSVGTSVRAALEL